MQEPVLAKATEKLARAGEQAGITVEDMIQILDAGASVATLLDLIEQSLRALPGETTRSSLWTM